MASPAWSFREASIEKRQQDDALELRDRQLGLASGQTSVSSWDGVVRHSPVEGYLIAAQGGLDPVRAGSFQYQAAKGTQEAAVNELFGWALKPVLSVVGGGLGAVQAAVTGEETLLRGELAVSINNGLRGELPGVSPMEALAPPGAPVNTFWPPKNGFYGPVTNETIQAGERFSRYGGYIDDAGKFVDEGKFIAPVNVPYMSRALPTGTDTTRTLSAYEVLKPIPNVESGVALPWFGEIGQGTQQQLPLSIQQLIDQGYIRATHRLAPMSP